MEEKEINWLYAIAILWIAALAISTIILQTQINEIKNNIITLNPKENQDIQQIFKNQEKLNKDMNFLTQYANETNCNQKLAERFFNNLTMELILNNDLNTTGSAYRQYLQDLNSFKKLGCWNND